MVTTVTIKDLAAARERGETILDVREHHEFISGHVPGAEHIPMHTVPVRLQEIPKDKPIYVVCESGGRSWQAAAYLTRNGYQAINVDGGTAAWRASGLPVETGATA